MEDKKLQAIEKMKNKKDVLGLIKMMKDNHESKTRVEAVDALGAIKDARAVEPLIKLLGDSYPYMPSHAACALGEIKDVRAVKPLIASLEHEAKGLLAGLREDAARALGKIGDSSAVEALIHALEDPYERLHGPAAEALGEIGDTRAVEPLITALKDDRAFPRAAEALGKLGDARAVEPLLENLERNNINGNRMAARSLIAFYQSGKITDQQKKLILSKRALITHHCDGVNETSCNRTHADEGIGLDFPL